MVCKTTAGEAEWKRRAISEATKLNQARLIAGDALQELDEAIKAISCDDESWSAAAVDRARVRLQQVMAL